MNLKYSKKNDKVNTFEETQIELNYPIVGDEKKYDKDSLKMLSLFSGCGGMDIGFEGGFTIPKANINPSFLKIMVEREVDENQYLLKKNKFKTIFANDILDKAKKAWVHYFSKRGYSSEVFQKFSIVDLVKLHRENGDVFPARVDIVTGGFPCKDFSIAGKRNGFQSHRNHDGELIDIDKASIETRGQLYMWMKEVIDITQPKIFIAENVKGLVNLSNVKEIIRHDFSSASENGYIVLEPQVLHAADYGVSQSRERIFFIGIKKSALKKSALKALSKDSIEDKYNPYPIATHAIEPKGKQVARVKLKDILSLVDEPSVSNDLSQMFYSKAKFMGKHCQGQIEVNLEGISPTIRSEHHGNIEFRRLAEINGGRYFKELKNGLIERRLTPRECALIQTFPLDFEFVIPNNIGRKNSYLVSPSAAYKLIGNAVPPLLAFHLAQRIQALWPLYFKK